MSSDRGRPPTNYRVGQAQSLNVRRKAAKSHDREVWNWLFLIAVLHEPKSLKEFAEILNEENVPTSRGGVWTTGLVDKQFRKRKVSAKGFVNRVTQPSPYEKNDFPTSLYVQYRNAIDRIDDPSERNGKWHSVVQVPPEQTDLIRHATMGVGQLVRVLSLGRYLCCFLINGETTEAECRAVDIEVYRYHKTREERLAASEIIRTRIFGPSKSSRRT